MPDCNKNWYVSTGKRWFDVLVSLAALTILLPVFVLLSLGVLATSGRPVLFLQTRLGRHGAPFTLYKFRTMRMNPSNQTQFDLAGRVRVTPIGRLLRDWKLDELPQLFNVLSGDMSLVGPRPEVSSWTKKHPKKWTVIHSQRPGITDHASIQFRNEESLLATATDPMTMYENSILPAKLELNIRYVRDIKFKTDLKILITTISNVLTKREKCH